MPSGPLNGTPSPHLPSQNRVSRPGQGKSICQGPASLEKTGRPAVSRLKGLFRVRPSIDIHDGGWNRDLLTEPHSTRPKRPCAQLKLEARNSTCFGGRQIGVYPHSTFEMVAPRGDTSFATTATHCTYRTSRFSYPPQQIHPGLKQGRLDTSGVPSTAHSGGLDMEWTDDRFPAHVSHLTQAARKHHGDQSRRKCQKQHRFGEPMSDRLRQASRSRRRWPEMRFWGHDVASSYLLHSKHNTA